MWGERITMRQLCIAAGIRESLLQRMVEMELVTPITEEEEPVFATEALRLVRRMLRLHYELGIGWSSMGIVMDLLARIEELERRLA